MSMLRVPVVNLDQLTALRSLLRLDYTRGMRMALDIKDASAADTCLKILTLTEYRIEAEQPLIVVAALMDFHGTPTAMLPLDSERFGFFEKLLNIGLATTDFPGIEPETLEPILEPMRAQVDGLKKVFGDAEYLDSESLRTKARLPETDSNPMMN